MKIVTPIVVTSLALSSALASADILSAKYSNPTKRYTHAVLGDDIEYGALELRVKIGKTQETRIITLPKSHVFEDIAPRLADMDGDGDNEVVVIETDMQRGAALAIYDENGKIAQTPSIGTSHRWLAPAGIADFNGNGKMDVAYVDRPHLAKVLRVWEFDNGRLKEIAKLQGLTNHRIGENFISGGVRICDGRAEIITADSSWQRIRATYFIGANLTSKDIGALRDKQSLQSALNC
ncbi:FG-GAP repeat domain-containing protein [Paramylibacter ulvae]|uniref:FG-GAP repeat domain-containing protein n=1 Tax=Paramylibacter ulvae TaxID=1651968 RepID=UPI001E34F56F|nr:VCBS repeat-containing protein [Amylibacter ulvae]